ncbi:MAG: CarD family transcriptional regulator, partial [Microbacteriaceae bacterium]
MTLEGLNARLFRAPTFRNALGHSGQSTDFSLVAGLRAPLLAGLLAERADQALLAIVATGRDSEALREALSSLIPAAEVIEFPAWETLPHERLSPSAETVGRRIHALRRMRQWQQSRQAGQRPRPLVVVASVRAALQPLADDLTSLEPLELVAGSRGNDLAELAARLVGLAYARVDMVARRGEFALRGGILDVFPPTAEHPVRVEFFGDEIEQIRVFAVADQRSLPDPVQRVELTASRELLLSPPVQQRAREMLGEFPNLDTMLAKIAEGIPVEGMESLAPALLDRLVPVTHYLPADAAIAVVAPERVVSRAVSLIETNREFLAAAWNAATAGAEAPIDPATWLRPSLDSGNFLSLGELRAAAGSRPWWTLSSFDSGAVLQTADSAATADNAATGDSAATGDAMAESSYLRIEADAVPSFQGHADGAVDHLAGRLAAGWAVAVVSAGAGLVERAADVLADRGLIARMVDALPADWEPGVAYLTKGSVEAGFELPELKLAVLSEAEFYGRAVGRDSRQVKKLASRRKNVVDPLQLKTGDFVVHQTHGIGRFLELVRREVSTGGRNPVKNMREFLLIEYAPSKRGYPGDKLYVPTDQLDLLTRYVGGEAPALSRM